MGGDPQRAPPAHRPLGNVSRGSRSRSGQRTPRPLGQNWTRPLPPAGQITHRCVGRGVPEAGGLDARSGLRRHQPSGGDKALDIETWRSPRPLVRVRFASPPRRARTGRVTPFTDGRNVSATIALRRVPSSPNPLASLPIRKRRRGESVDVLMRSSINEQYELHRRHSRPASNIPVTFTRTNGIDARRRSPLAQLNALFASLVGGLGLRLDDRAGCPMEPAQEAGRLLVQVTTPLRA